MTAVPIPHCRSRQRCFPALAIIRTFCSRNWHFWNTGVLLQSRRPQLCSSLVQWDHMSSVSRCWGPGWRRKGAQNYTRWFSISRNGPEIDKLGPKQSPGSLLLSRGHVCVHGTFKAAQRNEENTTSAEEVHTTLLITAPAPITSSSQEYYPSHRGWPFQTSADPSSSSEHLREAISEDSGHCDHIFWDKGKDAWNCTCPGKSGIIYLGGTPGFSHREEGKRDMLHVCTGHCGRGGRGVKRHLPV